MLARLGEQETNPAIRVVLPTTSTTPLRRYPWQADPDAYQWKATARSPWLQPASSLPHESATIAAIRVLLPTTSTTPRRRYPWQIDPDAYRWNATARSPWLPLASSLPHESGTIAANPVPLPTTSTTPHRRYPW